MHVMLTFSAHNDNEGKRKEIKEAVGQLPYSEVRRVLEPMLKENGIDYPLDIDIDFEWC